MTKPFFLEKISKHQPKTRIARKPNQPMSISNLSVVHPDAQIGQGVVIEAFAIIEADVVIGDGCWIGPHAIVMNGARLGTNCKIFPGAVVGSIPQDMKFKGEKTTIELGNRVTVREYCTLNRGTEANGRTVIGDDCLLMAYVHVAHDCLIGKNCIFANNVTLAGHIEVGDYTVLGGFVAIHQFVKIGEHVMVGGTGKVRKDIPPYIKADREPLAYAGVNSTGLQRRGFSNEQITNIHDAYRLLFIKGLNTKQALEQIEATVPDTPEKATILSFFAANTRGILPGPKLNGTKSDLVKLDAKLD